MKKAFAFAMPNLPMPTPWNRKKLNKVLELLKGLDGLIAITPYYPKGTLLFFETINQAKIARNRIEAAGPNQCGIHIMNAEIADDGQSVNITGKAEE